VWKTKDLSKKPSKKKRQMEWRRSTVLELLSQGMKQSEIASKLQFSEFTISEDVSFLRQQAKERIRHHIEDRLPLEFEKSLLSLELLKQKAWAVMEKIDQDDRTKLQAIEVVMACDGQKMDLLSHSHIIEHSIDFVENANKKLDNSLGKEKAKANEETQNNVVRTNNSDTQGPSEDNPAEASSSTDRAQAVF
jgi:transcriptional regulator